MAQQKRQSEYIERNEAADRKVDKSAVYSVLSLTNRARMIIVLIGLFIIVISVLLAFAFIINGDNLDSQFGLYIRNAARSNLAVVDINDEPVYGYAYFENGYADDELTRKATFHLLGNRYGAIPGSLLDSVPEYLTSYSKLTGYAADKLNIKLNIDLGLQKGAQSMLSDGGYNGAIVVMDYKTGEVKAIASTPGIDAFTAEESPTEDFMSKALDTFTPGSVFKTVTAAALLEKTDEVKSFRFTCTGKYGEVTCYNKTAHGTQDLSKILENSCNCGMAAAAKTYLTSEELDAFAEKCKILDDNAVFGIKAGKGHINSSENFAWSSNGQGEDTVSPLAVAVYFSAIANGGVSTAPAFLHDGTTYEETRIMSADTAEYIKNALLPVARHNALKITAAAKTGTAELDNARSHSWIAMFLCDENAPTYTVVTMLKNGGLSVNAKNLTVEFINKYIVGE